MTSTAYGHLDEILGVSFGDAMPGNDAVMAAFHVRKKEPFGATKEGTLGNVLIAKDVIAQVIAGLPEVMKAMQEDGGDRDVLPPPRLPVPAWNAGPKWDIKTKAVYLCTGLGVRDIAPESGAAVLFLQAALAGDSLGESFSADYLIGWSALKVFQEALPKVLRRLERGAAPTGRRH